MVLFYIIASVWFASAALFCLALGAAAQGEIPKIGELETSNIIPLEAYTTVGQEDNEVFLDDYRHREAA